MSQSVQTDSDADRRAAEIMDRRARKLAVVPTSQAAREVVATVAVVSAGSEQFGLPVDDLREIMPCPPVARLPGLPEWMHGIVQTRGDMVAVVDLGAWFGASGGAAMPYLAVLERPPRALGLMVETVVGFRDIYEDQIAQFLDGMARSQGLPIWATTRDLLTILDASRLFDSSAIIVGASSSAGSSGEGRQSTEGVIS